jgi:hypothetical protein
LSEKASDVAADKAASPGDEHRIGAMFVQLGQVSPIY